MLANCALARAPRPQRSARQIGHSSMHKSNAGPRHGSLAAVARFSSLSRAAIADRDHMRGSSMPLRRSHFIVSGLLAAGLMLSGCAASGPAGTASDNFNDPLEDTNRSIFAFNQSVDDNVLVPVAKAYRTVLPAPMYESLHDFMQNLNGPVIFGNDVMQGQAGLAANTLGRLAINTTLGVGGMFDVATRVGIPYHSNDFGITLGTWGFDEGPYIIAPVLGPTNPRDIVGQVADGFADPGDQIAASYHRLWASVARAVVSGIDVRSRNIENLEDIQRTSLDYYATIRSLYRQRRAAQIRHEEENLPNPTPIQGSDARPAHSMSYSIARLPPSQQSWPK
jgi:phospholipid-binding lipoprotein MlaA